MADAWPSYAELPVAAGAPAGTAWGVFADGDELGTLNFAGPEQAVAAASLVRRGAVFPLNWRLDLPDPALFHRSVYERTQPGSTAGVGWAC